MKSIITISAITLFFLPSVFSQNAGNNVPLYEKLIFETLLETNNPILVEKEIPKDRESLLKHSVKWEIGAQLDNQDGLSLASEVFNKKDSKTTITKTT